MGRYCVEEIVWLSFIEFDSEYDLHCADRGCPATTRTPLLAERLAPASKVSSRISNKTGESVNRGGVLVAACSYD